MSDPYIVTLDFGSTSAKCLIFDAQGKKVAQVKRPWEFPDTQQDSLNQPSFSSQFAWSQISSCCQEALNISHITLNEIACVIPTSQRHGAVLLDKEGAFLFSFTNADERSAQPWSAIAKQHGEKIYKETGRWPQPVFLPAHLLWLKQERPDIHKQIGKLLGIQDWLVYQLCGKLVSERTIASDLLLMNVLKGTWSSEIVKIFDLNPSILPPIEEAGAQIGKLSQQAANETGLLAGTPVLNGAADSQLALLGTGAIYPSDAAIIFGTSIPILYLLDSPCFHPDGATWTNSHLLPNQWVLESNSGDAGLCLNLFRSKFIPNLSSTNPIQEPENLPSLFELDKLAGELEQKKIRHTASWGPIIFHGREWPEVNGVVTGLKLLGNHSIGWADLYFSLIENSALAILGNLKQLVETAGKETQRVFLGGPAMESVIWQQILADVLGYPVLVPEEKEVTPLGAAVLAASKMGVYSDLPSTIKGMVRYSDINPRDDMVSFYQDRYLKWLDVYRFSIGNNNTLKE